MDKVTAKILELNVQISKTENGESSSINFSDDHIKKLVGEALASGKVIRTAITPGVSPGECWAFQNFPGFLVVKLSARIAVEAVSLEHISKRLSSTGRIDSALKQFEVYGLVNENDPEPVLLGTYEYRDDGLEYTVR
ncbi:Sad1 / UNC-like C-terminal [Popillia japonica]|uniref:Sad1 / UNC-like C-terminal n=1 Tax=Popillia japonica TaxID=7064 RepID=A0AAW1JI71_POPJA